MRRFELIEGTAAKFWEVEVDAANYSVRYGRLGTAGQSLSKTAADAAKAQLEVDKLIKEKTGKGYTEVGASALLAATAVAAVAAPAAASRPIAAASPARAASDDGERARAYFDEWRRKNCLKTLDDFQRWQEHYQFAGARAKRQQSGARGLGINATAEGAVGLARRGFLRAYAQGAWGLSRTMSYSQLAAWLTAQGYPTKADELKNAKRASLVKGVVPDSPQVRALLDTLKAQFPALEVDQFLVRLTEP